MGAGTKIARLSVRIEIELVVVWIVKIHLVLVAGIGLSLTSERGPGFKSQSAMTE